MVSTPNSSTVVKKLREQHDGYAFFALTKKNAFFLRHALPMAHDTWNRAEKFTTMLFTKCHYLDWFGIVFVSFQYILSVIGVRFHSLSWHELVFV